MCYTYNFTTSYYYTVSNNCLLIILAIKCLKFYEYDFSVYIK